MDQTSGDAIDTFFGNLSQARECLLLLDYDGTLAPFVENRLQAYPAPGLRELLDQILADSHTRIVLVTGRDSEELTHLLGLAQPVEIWGCHGREYRGLDGKVRTTGVTPEAQESLREGYEAARAADPRADRSEYKTGCATLHWRGLGEKEKDRLREKVLAVWEPLAERHGFEIKNFDGGIELCVPGRTKGDAVTSLLSEYDDRLPCAAFLGDDLTDEDGFEALGDRGLSVLVRNEPRPTRADVRITMPDGVLDFLQRWYAATTM